MIKILFICHGNICRSPMAAYVMKDLIKKAGLEADIMVDSAAVSREELGHPMYPPAFEELARHGISGEGHCAKEMQRSDYDQFDLLIGMDNSNMRRMQHLIGDDVAQKCYRLMDFTNQSRDVADPWYTGDFEQTWHDVCEGCQALLQWIRRESFLNRT